MENPTRREDEEGRKRKWKGYSNKHPFYLFPFLGTYLDLYATRSPKTWSFLVTRRSVKFSISPSLHESWGEWKEKFVGSSFPVVNSQVLVLVAKLQLNLL